LLNRGVIPPQLAAALGDGAPRSGTVPIGLQAPSTDALKLRLACKTI